ncbi:ABC transporter ATP-binding protein [Tabrizicola oligotrophica]|uniref:ABC transporter ATP-binding protein n=1 Tax=Tabrizicola oligotrophica TaxID=2710650 RepID=A0A6M0QRV1_9RHOB|nr:ABC transporter ATP-binding protein [Tabrizicola oligotrophica]NEY90146.1 ABC transporter ATP-binding protein [Tabrizicola oligotrophica]
MTLVVTGLVVQDGNRTAVHNVDLTVEPGKVTAVIGANGAGKSELVLALAGVLPVTGGEVRLDGAALTGKGPEAIRRAGIAAVPEGHRVLTDLSIDDNLRAAGSLIRGGLAERLAETYAVFPELAERKAQLAGTLSGGQQQMVALAHALMSRPRFLLIDEMSLGLAPLIVKRLLGVVTDLKARGVGILLIEQFTDLALGIAESAVVLRGGKMRYNGPASALAEDSRLLHEAYFGI